MSRLLICAAVACGAAASASAARAAPPRQRLDGTKPIVCFPDPSGVTVRVQCDRADQPERTCLFARDCRNDGDACLPLEHTSYCAYPEDGDGWAARVERGYVFVPARADVVAGYYRDEEGRAFQVEFDLNQRLFIGGGARYVLGDFEGADDLEAVGARIDLGARIDVLDAEQRTKSRFRFLELSLGTAPFDLRASLLRFDKSSAGDEPFLRLTTFVGGPARHDLYLQGGWWLDLLGLEHRPRALEDVTHVRISGGGVTWDLWQEVDMTSFLRLKLGVGLDDLVHGGEPLFSVAPLVALEGDFTIDDAGFHHVLLSSRFELPFIEDGDRFARHRRFENSLAYELILIAIDDQPLSLVLDVAGGYRDDLPTRDGWDVAAHAGLRLSLWAPPRDLAARDQMRARRERPDATGAP